MKKIFTFVVAAMAALVMNAEPVVLFEGNEKAGWGTRIELNCDWNTVEEGDVLNFTAITGGNEEGWAAFHLLDGSWEKVVSDLSFEYEEGATKYTTYKLTAATLEAARTAGGLGVQGFGFTLLKVELLKGEATAIENVTLMENGVRYNLMGQTVGEDYKGIVILNGKKMLQ